MSTLKNKLICYPHRPHATALLCIQIGMAIKEWNYVSEVARQMVKYRKYRKHSAAFRLTCDGIDLHEMSVSESASKEGGALHKTYCLHTSR